MFMLILLFLANTAFAAQLVEVYNFGSNPSGIRMFEYVPANVLLNPPLLVVLHWCGGSARSMYFASKYASLADQHSFIVLYPSVTRPSKCWDVYSSGGLRRNGGSDSQGIVAMVDYEVKKRCVDASRVFVTGYSSGGMMTNVLMAEYPDVFSAGSAFAGVPYTCFATTGTSIWNSSCATGKIIQTPLQWGNLARAAYPGYWGERPRVQLLHGTEDDVLYFQNMQEELKQWANVLEVSQRPEQTDQPRVGIPGIVATRRRYGDTGDQPPLEAITLHGATHYLNMTGTLADLAARFMGLIS